MLNPSTSSGQARFSIHRRPRATVQPDSETVRFRPNSGHGAWPGMDPETGSATGFACGEEALADLLEDWVVAAGDEGCDVDCGSHRGASAADDGLAFRFPRLACPWGEPGQGCAASIGSVWARLPSACAKWRTCAGLSTTTGSPAAPSAAATTVSYPPVASTPIHRGAIPPSRTTSSSRPAASRLTRQSSPPFDERSGGATCTSSQSFDTSIPIQHMIIVSQPCTNGLVWPKRLFGFDNRAAERSS